MQIPSFAGSTNDIYFFMACIYISWWSDFMEEYQLENYRIFHHVNKICNLLWRYYSGGIAEEFYLFNWALLTLFPNPLRYFVMMPQLCLF